MITIKIKTDNAAFDGESAGREVADILVLIAARFSHAELERDSWPIMDSNGNRVGSVKVTR